MFGRLTVHPLSVHPSPASRLVVNPNNSQTMSTVAAGGFDITYVDGTSAGGDYIQDQFAVGQVGQAHMLLQMGLATNYTGSSPVSGIMGIGYDNNEATNVFYPNFMDQMVAYNLTNTKLYSLWLNDADSSTGTILFGGIDTEKYYGTLYSMPIHQDSNGNYTSFLIGLTSLSITPQTGSTISLTNASFFSLVIPDSSTTEIYLPNDVVSIIYNNFEVVYDDSTAFVDCKYSNSSYMTFEFESGSTINVPYSELINKLLLPGSIPSNLPFSDVCVMGIQPGGDNANYLLGDFFLRSAYVVFDLTNNRIGIAQSNLNSTASNVVEVPAGAASIPKSTGVASSSFTITTFSSSTASFLSSTALLSSGSNPASSIVSTTPTSTPTNSATSSPLPKAKHTTAIGVGVAVPIVAILAAILGFCLWRRRRPQSQTAPSLPELSAPPYIAGAARAEMKESPSEIQDQYAAAPSNRGGGVTQSRISELGSDPAVSPRDTLASFERKPVPKQAVELPVYESQGDETGVSPNLNDYHAEQKPISNLTAGPVE